MSYSTRRSGAYSQQTSQKNIGNIGQRRPVVTNNFVHGGQLSSQVKPTGIPTTPTRTQQNQQAAASTPFRNQPAQQHQTTPQQTNVAKQQVQQQLQAPQQATQQQPTQQQQVQQQLQLKKEQDAEQQLQQEQKKEAQENEQKLATGGTNGTPMEVGEPKKKPFWLRTGGKITRRERVRRRNVRLSKILQPKNAVMILNELVKNTSYLIEELPIRSEGNQFKATVVYEGIEHVGYGRNKINAKNAAAEAALKHYVKTNKLTELKKDEEGNEKMDVSEDDTTQSPLPWQHVASFALYKLFCSWGEDPNLVKPDSAQNQSPNVNVNADKPHENKPAKKMPENPETINPLMLINQMLPHAQFEEIGKSGNPPDVVFSFRCNVDGQSFVGMGPNKKSAKRMAAFGACHKILSISYPPEIYVPSY
ncbi:double-stranded RNA-specific editase Adar [Diorhabda sublineata]|uniref:double-stranded RNA-specific editase Adar n=1 Tax=Diorhabda sublineata TaxID=1163346 RepID=UPI0024E06F6C|nr:double-stranded RNA-specific editase Adar [Diorhabda sublineata]